MRVIERVLCNLKTLPAGRGHGRTIAVANNAIEMIFGIDQYRNGIDV
jgi:hypothetical protein